MKSKIKKICFGCKNEFEVPDTVSGRKRKYCKQTCQIPWLKGKTGVYSPETIEKKRQSSINWIWSKDGIKNREKTRIRNLSDKNPWRHPKREWIEKGQATKKITLLKHPEIKLTYRSMLGKHHSPEVIEKIKIGTSKTLKEKYGVKNVCDLRWVREKISKTKIERYKNGKYKIKKGKDHHNWKGGYSGVFQLIYSDPILYKKWKYPILARDGFKCIRCGQEKNLQIHHNTEKLSEIYHKITKNVNVANMSFEDKTKIKDSVVEYHLKNNVSGITLCKPCHKKIHQR
jgi:hypothetical protein